MELPTRKHLMIFSGTANQPLAEEVVAHLGMKLSDCDVSQFADSEQYVRFNESVRGCDAFVIQSHCAPVDFHLMQQLLMIDALKRASAKRITAVSPFYPYARQDKKTRSREPIASKLIADFYEAAGANRVLSVDLHTGQIQGFFDIPLDHLTALPMLADHFAERRNVSATLAVVGEVEGRVCVIADDMIDTAGTLVNGAEALMEAGAAEVYAAATHAVLSEPATDRIKNSPILQVVVTNTLPIPSEKQIDKLVVLSIAPTIAQTIKAVFEEESVSELFHGENQP